MSSGKRVPEREARKPKRPVYCARATVVFGLVALLPLFRFGEANPHGGAAIVVPGILFALSLIALAVPYLALEWWQRRTGSALLDGAAKAIFFLMLFPLAGLVWILVIVEQKM